MSSESAEMWAVRRGPAGFCVERGGQAMWSVSPQGSRWCVAGPVSDAAAAWSLERPGAAGFLLRSAEGLERARTMPVAGAPEGGTRYVLLEDARLFRIVRRPPRQDGFDLEGWEVPGAYLRAVPEGGGWRLSVEPAGAGIEGALVLTLMLAAEALDAEERLRSETA